MKKYVYNFLMHSKVVDDEFSELLYRLEDYSSSEYYFNLFDFDGAELDIPGRMVISRDFDLAVDIALRSDDCEEI
ncbi:hypothetical protein D3C75_793270 [compost metagenome]